MAFKPKKACVGKANYLLRFARREKLLQELVSLRTVSGMVHNSPHHGNKHVSDSNRSGHISQEQACLQKVTYVVKGLFHQGDRQFSESSAGRQCSCNALVAIAFLNMYDVITPSHVNKILQEGDKLYRIIRERLLCSGKLHISERLTTNDLPSQLFMGNVLHKFKHFESIYGRLHADNSSSDTSNLEPLHVIVHRAFQISNTNIMVIGNDMITLFNNGKDRCGIFDSHSRNNKGMPTVDGHAVLLYFPSLPTLVDHLYKLVDSLSPENSTVLEIKPITISSTMQTKSGVFTNSLAFELFFQRQISQKKLPCTNTSALTLSMADKSKNPKSRNLRENRSEGITACEVPNGHEQLKDCKQRKYQPSDRRKKLKLAVDSFVSDNPQQTSVSQKESLTHCKTKEESEILLLTVEIQKLENYLNFKLQMTNDILGKHPPNCRRYAQFSDLTAAKIILFNKPRAREVMQLTVASFIEQSTKLDPSDETLQCLSGVEKKLCERLDVVKVPDEDGKLVPILLTPRTKKAMETLLDTRSHPKAKMDSSNPYLFAKCGKLKNNPKASVNVLNRVAKNADLLHNARLQKHVWLPQDVRLEKQVAAISQILAMQDNELDWLKSQITDVVAVDRDFSYLQFSTLQMAKVVQLLHAIESGQAHHFTQKKTWSQLQLSDICSAAKHLQAKDYSEDVRSNGNVTSIADNMQGPQEAATQDNRSIVSVPEGRQEHQEVNNADISDRDPVRSNAEISRNLQQWETSDVRSTLDVFSSNTGNSKDMEEGESSYVESMHDTPIIPEYSEESFEEKYSDVLRRANLLSSAEDTSVPQEDSAFGFSCSANNYIPSMAEYLEEPKEEKYADVLRRANLASSTDDMKEVAGYKCAYAIKREKDEDQEDDKSTIRISVDLSNVYEDIYDTDEQPEEKYSDVMNRDGIPNMMEDAEELPEQKYSEVMRRNNGV
ncbi:hypothetical protein HOLleu_04679 [Holothuria leucospilota]|uniref:Peptidase C76 domain-containing protein n=1 Tax=Holothuria leucospilota TaxID=206669 RepID=A0A9Q1CUC2_HOLLE|nr:hypothetical protein HOLleu_04679 [Holothuria leucospilota]